VALLASSKKIDVLAKVGEYKVTIYIYVVASYYHTSVMVGIAFVAFSHQPEQLPNKL